MIRGNGEEVSPQVGCRLSNPVPGGSMEAVPVHSPRGQFRRLGPGNGALQVRTLLQLILS